MVDNSRLTPIEQFVIDFVRKLRTDRGITQADIGYIIGVSQTFVANIENRKSPAKYNLNHINKLADHLGVSPKDFMPSSALNDESDN